ncbi:dTDP-4-dehydrorhamnose reductase [bacterium]|nr:dTDP-4-dehydrorhamnose reductase [bacterium]
MKILLLGKNGLLGREITHAFNNKGNDEFFALNHTDLDITDKDALFLMLKDFKPNYVINTAAFTFVDECEAKKEFVMDVNGYANGALAEICNDLNCHLTYFSTDYVFDGTKDGEYTEDDTPSPINVYGHSKLLGEQLIQKNTDNFYIVRTSWLFGMHSRNFVTTMLERAKKNKEIKVVDDQIGKPTYSHDLAGGVFDMIHDKSLESGIYHLVNEEKTSWYHFAKKIFDATNSSDVNLIRISSNNLDRVAPRPLNSSLKNSKLPKLRTHPQALEDYLHQLNII